MGSREDLRWKGRNAASGKAGSGNRDESGLKAGRITLLKMSLPAFSLAANKSIGSREALEWKGRNAASRRAGSGNRDESGLKAGRTTLLKMSLPAFSLAAISHRKPRKSGMKV
ncbi:hypothetical protein [Siphonobacter sp. SORGH_AS_0500]|uniref:hypothetical protein n=1 Tax=Siphonobacter sp. SORGH_AS_0500 TaxID=1864824 RepID=UPI000CA740DA|nr:hypothetical protein [Siphonobacter sp. SORGH_AS_0500]MDR6195747.1 hypothetical protein [Siphonobacter sp. SORGH_AS_0500]PKK37515.1 hypothetical protein BWI96_06530 [Siphonobacter sp. SORGH_AS_0500]